ncbi:MAG: acyl carrier protein [Kiritimatiellae bacterium]|nr:acyl carrier protein [Kiritimatiellia bacterium]
MKTKEEILAAIRDVLVSEFECDAAKLTPEARLYEDLDLDSIDAVDLVVRLQQQTSLKVTAEDFKFIRTLGDVAGVIARLAAEQMK